MHPFIVPDARVFAAALAVDLLAGEYPNALHPVAWMGKLISELERIAPARGRLRQLAAGAIIAVVVSGGSAAAAILFLYGSCAAPAIQALGAIYLLKSTFALRALGGTAMTLRGHLAGGRLDEARSSLCALCSRDAGALDEPEISGAVIESVAENASDSFVAPLLYYAALGLPGAMLYRAANTLDSRIGYRGKYEYLGKAGARLDDLLNWVPARVTALVLWMAGLVCGCSARNGLRIWRRDRRRTSSPNAGHPMSMMAGLLGVRLVKRDCYVLGDGAPDPSVGHIDEAWRVVLVAGALAAGGLFVALGVRHAFSG